MRLQIFWLACLIWIWFRIRSIFLLTIRTSRGCRRFCSLMGIAGLSIVQFNVSNRKQINLTAGQSESECRQRWSGGGGRSERQIKLEIATRYFGQGGEQSRLTGAGGRNAERESIARAFARARQQHGAGGKRGI